MSNNTNIGGIGSSSSDHRRFKFTEKNSNSQTRGSLSKQNLIYQYHSIMVQSDYAIWLNLFYIQILQTKCNT